ncbi:MAG: sigma-70 family RNA polymerase sigma factor [Acidimicrobiales bacterium]
MSSGGGDTFEEAFSELVLPAFRVALRILGDVAEAEDVAAEALARALRSSDRVGAMPHRRAWVVRVASNLAIDRTRRRPPVLGRPDHMPDVAEAVTLRLALGAALRQLPRRQGQVVALRYLGGLTEAEVARSMGISPNSVKKHTARAVSTLRTRLGADWQEVDLALE